MVATALTDIGRSLREGFFMFWVTLWPLVLGFTLSGVVQSFVSRDAIRSKLGNHGPAATGRAALYGMASSSCSYAASAMSKSLFVKGADFVAANVFMFASTNLVIELGIVLVALMGWQFAASEFVGGCIMIVLLATVGGLFLRGKAVVAARQRLLAAFPLGQDDPAATTSPAAQPTTQPAAQPATHRPARRRARLARLRSGSRWADASSYTMSDLTMLRRELAFGYLIAGFLTVLVPTHVWSALLLHGHGSWTSVENALVGPLVAIVSCVCSVGSVPLAAALWHGGTSFGGVVAFLFADLIAFPLLLVYRRYYGTRLMLRMLAVFWVTMSIAGLITQALFRLAGLVPTTRPAQVVADHFSWNDTTYLNLIFLALFGTLYWVYRNRHRFGDRQSRTADPVCGMPVDILDAPATSCHKGRRYYFCSDACRQNFDADPDRYAVPDLPSRPSDLVSP
jgi:uncharacterized membrane protein YraQ (UPF0718 family)/YHS domain-containing protein